MSKQEISEKQLVNYLTDKIKKEIKTPAGSGTISEGNQLLKQIREHSGNIKSVEKKYTDSEIAQIFAEYGHLFQKKLKTPVNKALLNAWFTSLETSEVSRIAAFIQLINTSVSMASSFEDFWTSEKITLCFEAMDFENEYSVLELVTDSLADSVLEKSQIVGILQKLQDHSYNIHYERNELNKTSENKNPEIIIDFDFKKLTKNYFPVEMTFKFVNLPESREEKEKLRDELLYWFGGEAEDIEQVKKQIRIPEVLLNVKLHPIATNPMMQFILSIFSGTNNKKTRGLDKILSKPKEERTQEELMMIDNYINPVIEIIPQINYTPHGEVDVSRYNAIIKNNKIVIATSELQDMNLRNDEILMITTAKLIKDCFSTKGLMYFLGLNYLMYKKGKNGLLSLELDDILEALNYKRDPSGSFNSRLKKEASDIIKIFGTLSIQLVNKTNKVKDTLTLSLFSLPMRREIEKENSDIIKGQFLLRAESWIMDSYFPMDDKSPQFTYIFDSILGENQNEKTIAIFLYIFFSIRWRIDTNQEFKITTLLNWLDIDYESKSGKHNRMHYLYELEKELNYMKELGYLADWKIKLDGKVINKPFSELDKPFEKNYIIVPIPPEIIKRKIDEIKDKKVIYLNPDPEPEKQTGTLLTQNEFLNILEISDLTVTEFAKKVGVSRETLSRIKTGKMNISLEISNKIKEAFNSTITGQLSLFGTESPHVITGPKAG